MYTKADLKNNQTIINATTTYSVSYIAGPVYMKKSAITRGYVIEFIDSNH